MAGARLLAARHVSERAGDLTPWVIALAPGALTLVLGYSDAFFLAAIVWAVVAVDHRRWWSAGLLAAAATASRPNGVIAVVAVMAVALLAGAGWRRLVIVATPSVAFLAGWMLYLHHTTGDALLFWHAKSLWVETTFSEFLDDPTHQRLVVFHIVVLLAYVVPYADALATAAAGVDRGRGAGSGPVARPRPRRTRPLRDPGLPHPDRRRRPAGGAAALDGDRRASRSRRSP